MCDAVVIPKDFTRALENVITFYFNTKIIGILARFQN